MSLLSSSIFLSLSLSLSVACSLHCHFSSFHPFPVIFFPLIAHRFRSFSSFVDSSPILTFLTANRHIRKREVVHASRQRKNRGIQENTVSKEETMHHFAIPFLRARSIQAVWKSVISIVILVLVPSRERHLRVTNASQRAQNDEKELIDSSGGLYAWELYFVSAIDGCVA